MLWSGLLSITTSDKNLMFTYRPPQAFPVFTKGGTVIPLCSKYCELGTTVSIWAVIPVRPRTIPLSKADLHRFNGSPTTLKASLSQWPGPYFFFHSVVDYLSHAEIELPRASVRPKSPFPPTVPAGRALIRTVSYVLRSLNIVPP